MKDVKKIRNGKMSVDVFGNVHTPNIIRITEKDDNIIGDGEFTRNQIGYFYGNDYAQLTSAGETFIKCAINTKEIIAVLQKIYRKELLKKQLDKLCKTPENIRTLTVIINTEPEYNLNEMLELKKTMQGYTQSEIKKTLESIVNSKICLILTNNGVKVKENDVLKTVNKNNRTKILKMLEVKQHWSAYSWVLLNTMEYS